MKNAVNILVFCIYIFLCAPLELSAASKDIRVGVYDNKPLIFMTESGPQGIYIDVLENIAKTEGWNLQYSQGTWNDVFTLLTRNEIDILPAVAFMESRLAQLDFCEQTLISNWGQIYARKNLSMESIQNLEGKKIAALSQDTHGEYFKTLLAQLGISYESVLIENYPKLFQALESGKVDAGVVNYIAALNYAENYDLQSTPIVFNPIQIRYAVSKGDPADLLIAMDWHITNFKADKNSVYHTSMAHWFGAKSPSFQFPGWIKWVFIILSGVLIVFVTGNIVLRVQVKAKTKALLIELKNRELAEKAVKKSENLGRKMVANIGDVIVIIDQEGINKYKSPNIEKIFGWKPEEVVGASTWDNVHPDDIESTQQFFEKIMHTPDAVGTMECRYRCRDGSYKWIEFTGTNLFHDPDIQGLLGNYQEITERKQADEALRKSEAKYRELFDSNKDGIIRTELDGEIVEVNNAFLEMTGYESFNELKSIYQQLTPEKWHDFEAEIVKNQVIGRGYSDEYEKEYIHRNGTVLLISIKVWLVKDNDQAVGMWGIVRDITQRKRAETALAQKSKLLEESQVLAKLGSWEWNIVHDKWYFSEHWKKIHGVSANDLDTTKLIEIAHPEDAPHILKAFADAKEQGKPYDIIHRIIRADNKEIRYIKAHGELEFDQDIGVRMMGTAQDITEFKEAEAEREKLREQLNQAQKMESVGRLAGGVAHDFNNMLTIILGNTELAMENMAPDNPLRNNLDEIFSAARRSADITRQLLAFARKQTIAPKVLDLNQTIISMLKMLRRLIGEDIDLAWLPGKKVWPVKMDPAQIDQILANLFVNARDAIADVGKITIETGTATFDSAYCAEHPGFVAGDFVLLAVSDDGCGMDKETLANLFEPFFTTKDVDKGTGLGLATVYGIVKQNDGFINLYSEPDQGTTFRIYLPRHLPKTVSLPEKEPDKPSERGHENVLLVEDEPSILKMTRMMLEREGYKVLAAGTPGEAIHLANEHAGEIHLLMTDVVMPEMNGRDLAKNILSLYPHLRCLFMSGYTANVIAHHGVLDEGVQYIQKPFAKQDLAIKVREVLDETK